MAGPIRQLKHPSAAHKNTMKPLRPIFLFMLAFLGPGIVLIIRFFVGELPWSVWILGASLLPCLWIAGLAHFAWQATRAELLSDPGRKVDVAQFLLAPPSPEREAQLRYIVNRTGLSAKASPTNLRAKSSSSCSSQLTRARKPPCAKCALRCASTRITETSSRPSLRKSRERHDSPGLDEARPRGGRNSKRLTTDSVDGLPPWRLSAVHWERLSDDFLGGIQAYRQVYHYLDVER
jgi:hypothetical protein